MKYIIDKEMLLNLLQNSAELAALDNGGVGDWSWCGESCEDFLRNAGCEDFEEVAIKNLAIYIEKGKIKEYFPNESDYDNFENMGQ